MIDLGSPSPHTRVRQFVNVDTGDATNTNTNTTTHTRNHPTNRTGEQS